MSLITTVRLFPRLHVASEEYHYSLSKKKVSEAVDTEDKLLSIDALGVVMIQHGEEFGEESAFGTFVHSFLLSSVELNIDSRHFAGQLGQSPLPGSNAPRGILGSIPRDLPCVYPEGGR